MMIKKIVLIVLGITVTMAAGAALTYQAVNSAADAAAPVATPVNTAGAGYGSQSSTGAGGGNANAGAGNENAGQSGTQLNAAAGQIGSPWQATGTITALSAVGMDVLLTDGTPVFVELGPQTYWQAQGITLAPEMVVTIDGFANGDQYHAATVTLADGQALYLRSETGTPLWSGGESNGQGGAGNGGAANPSGTPQVTIDEWVTLTGELIAMTRGNMTVLTTDGQTIPFQAGQPTFFESQGVAFQVGDAVSVVGYWQDGQFMAGEITQTATGLRVMLRDPNGRPLWAGPGGSNGNGGNGNGNNGNQGGHGQQGAATTAP